MWHDTSFYRFNGYSDFEDFILDVPRRFNFPSEVFSFGETVEGRKMYCLRLGKRQDEKPGVLYMSLVHGVEFIGGETNLAVMEWFSDIGNSEKAERILADCNVYIVPVINPDAYELAVREKKKYGLTFARKNARGVDLNRNFSVEFGKRGAGLWGGLPLKFMPVYRGPHAFSEPEVRCIRSFILGHPIKTSLSFHSSGRVIGFPYCHTGERCPDYQMLKDVAHGMRRRQKGRKYDVMQEFDYVPTSGDMDDWLYEEGGVLPFLIEIGRFGFLSESIERWFNPFAWVNMPDPDKEIGRILPGVIYLAEWTAENFGTHRTGENSP